MTSLQAQARAARQRRGLMGLGAVADDQAPVQVSKLAATDPIMSTASAIASRIMLKMAGKPRDQRVPEMVRSLNKAESGLGDKARAEYLRLSAARPGREDQTMFDVVSASVANLLVRQMLALRAAHGGTAGLGQTFGQYQGRTSQGVEDANAVMCSTVLPVASVASGLFSQFGVGSSSPVGAGTAQSGAQIAGCGAGQMLAQNQHTEAMAQMAQNGSVQALALQAGQQRAMMQYMLMGGGALMIGLIAFAIVKK